MRILLLLIFDIIFLISFSVQSFAIYQPQIIPNNKFGIHILDTSEISKASDLVNSKGGNWGYVTIPIQYGDRDLVKWQKFMDDCSQYHIIPILRIATEAYYQNTSVWRKPTEYDIVDFVNFLNSLNWPIKNRYVLIYNEINRNDEWGGLPPSPEEYADFLSYTINVFKSQSTDFFIIAAGLDNASPNDGVKYMDNLVFLRRMGKHNPEVFTKIDGFSSHSYPNPNFAQAPSKTKLEGTSTYLYESDIVNSFAKSIKPVFITETGWNADVLSQNLISSYYVTAMTEIWGKDNNVIAVTPFILESNGGPFDKFTFIKNGQFTMYAKAYQDIRKVNGAPILNKITSVLAASSVSVDSSQNFSPAKLVTTSFSKIVKNYFKTVFAVGK